MSHPIVPRVYELAKPTAQNLGLELADASFHTDRHPPVLRIAIRNLQGDTSLDDCECMSRALETVLEDTDAIPMAYVLEVSSPGISNILVAEKDFIAFKGFPVIAFLAAPYKGKTSWSGDLLDRNDTQIRLTQKGRVVVLPRSQVDRVELKDG